MGNEEVALGIIKIYYKEVMRYRHKRALELNDIVKSYHYVFEKLKQGGLK